MPDMIGSGEGPASTRVMQAMMTMKKIDVQKLEDAFVGK
jgi:hypothetical protein